jgi:chemotaxis protein MotB
MIEHILKRYLIFTFAIGLLAGCVSKNTYLAKEQEARLFKSDLEEIRRRYAKLKSQYRDLEQVNAKLDSKGQELVSRLDEVRAESEEKNEEMGRLKKEIQELKKILSAKADSLSKTVAELMSKLDSLEVEKTALTKELAGYKDLVSLRDAEIRGLKRKYDQKAQKLKSVLDKTQQKTQKIEKKLEKTKEKLADLEKESTAYKEMTKQMAEEIKKGNIAITELQGKLRVSLLSQILFDSGKTKIKKDGFEVLRRVSKVLLSKAQGKEIRIEGHTDSDKIYGSLQQKYPTNWELSAVRAINVARFLVEEAGLDPRRIYAAGYGEFRPIAPNDTPENKAQNRRIEIVLAPR